MNEAAQQIADGYADITALLRESIFAIGRDMTEKATLAADRDDSMAAVFYLGCQAMADSIAAELGSLETRIRGGDEPDFPNVLRFRQR